MLTQEEQVKWSKYMYINLLHLDYYENLSTSAYEYFEKVQKNNNTALKHDFLEDVAELDVSICRLYYQLQPMDYIASKLKSMFEKESCEFDPIESTLIDVLWEKMYGNIYDNNKYHQVRFYVEYGIKVDLDKFNQIDGADIGGWCNVWDDNPQDLYNKYMSISNTIEIQHPSKQETAETLKSIQSATQMTIFDMIKQE